MSVEVYTLSATLLRGLVSNGFSASGWEPKRANDVGEACRFVHLEPAEENAAALQHFIPKPVALGGHESA